MYIAVAMVGQGEDGKTIPLFQIQAENLPQAKKTLPKMLEAYGINTDPVFLNEDLFRNRKVGVKTLFWVHELSEEISDLGWLKALEAAQRREKEEYDRGLACLNINP